MKGQAGIGMVVVFIAFLYVVLLSLAMYMHVTIIVNSIPRTTIKGQAYCLYVDNYTWSCNYMSKITLSSGEPLVWRWTLLNINGEIINMTNNTIAEPTWISAGQTMVLSTHYTATNQSMVLYPNTRYVSINFLQSGTAYVFARTPSNDEIFFITALARVGFDNRSINPTRYIVAVLFLENMTYNVYLHTASGDTLLASGTAWGTTSTSYSLASNPLPAKEPFLVFINPSKGVRYTGFSLTNTSLYTYRFKLPPVTGSADNVLADYLVMYNATSVALGTSPSDATSVVVRVTIMDDGNMYISVIGARTDNIVMVLVNPGVTGLSIDQLVQLYETGGYTLPYTTPYAVVVPWNTAGAGQLGSQPLWNPVSAEWVQPSPAMLKSVFNPQT